MRRGPLRVFYSYAHEDADSRDHIDQHLELLRRQHLVVGWHDRHIVPGTEWNEIIGEKLKSADIILLLVSHAFMTSDYVNAVEIPEAMKAHESGDARVVPILLERISGREKAPFARLQILPSGAKPVSEWDDPVDAFRDIARGVRRVAKDIIIEGGGPFEFGAHEFTEAELGALPKIERERAAAGLERLRDNLITTIPRRKYESNLLVATWCLRQFGRTDPSFSDLPEALFYMAEIISSFDLVALQEVDRNLQRFDALVEILGPDWSALLTDTVPGGGGHGRFAILYYEPRVDFRNFSSKVIVPSKKSTTEKQFLRPPLVAKFRSGVMEFHVCTAHIVFGRPGRRGFEKRLEEIRKLARYLRWQSRIEEQTDLLLLGDLQMDTRESPILDVLRESKVQIPDELLHPTNLKKTRYYDLIGFVSSKRSIPLVPGRPCSGAYDLFQHVLRDEDRAVYEATDAFCKYAKGRSEAASVDSRVKSDNERRYLTWKTYLISDHLPLWAELSVQGASGDLEANGRN
jgi:endonuclease/exonuclease/phosphatase family metal-dependent hydrolase